MSFIASRMLELYARWREEYLSAHPEKRLFPWLFRGVPMPEEPIITLTPKGEGIITDIKNKGILVTLTILALLALSRNSK